MVACEKAFCLGDMLARSFSWLSCARSFGRSLARSFVQLARLFSRTACFRAFSRSSLLRSLAWLVCASLSLLENGNGRLARMRITLMC